jgi:hypothetical protein
MGTLVLHQRQSASVTTWLTTEIVANQDTGQKNHNLNDRKRDHKADTEIITKNIKHTNQGNQESNKNKEPKEEKAEFANCREAAVARNRKS